MMMTRKQLQATLSRHPALERVAKERIVDHAADSGDEEPYDELDALRDLDELDLMPRALHVAWKRFLVDLGAYRQVTQADLDRMVVLGRRKASPDLRLDGKMFLFEAWPEIV